MKNGLDLLNKLRGSFTFSEYTKILDILKISNYQSVSFDEFNPEKDHQVLIRHDIDYDWITANRIAIIEKGYQIKSTFFFLITGDYNILNIKIQAILSNIKKMGHHIGLHWDSENQITDYIPQYILQNLIKEFTVYSNHRPFKENQKKLDGFFLKNTFKRV